MDFRKITGRLSKTSSALTVLGIVIILLFAQGYVFQKHIISLYNDQESFVLSDRNGNTIIIEKNEKENYALYIQEVPSRFQELLLQKEDRYFFYHLGTNPWSTLQATLYQIGIGERKASSTITQQLVKILLGNESNRTLHNKITELLYATWLEIFQDKETILTMYANSIYFGNHTQGLFTASRAYFGVDPEFLNDNQILQLLSTINSPTHNNPGTPTNQQSTLFLARALNTPALTTDFTNYKQIQSNSKNYSVGHDASFELLSFLPNSQSTSCKSTIDLELTEKIRGIVQQNIAKLFDKNARNAAVVVIKLPENEVLSVIGSPDPHGTQDGYKINMALEPRPIGSTVKPFLYMKAFEKGVRPYTLIDDREYKYITSIGSPLYPQNFDTTYRGEVTLHYSLSNSLNIPALKILEYLGIENFYEFLRNDLDFTPLQDFETYQLGVALGNIEMSLFDLTHYFTLFANNGMLTPTTVFSNNSCKQLPEYAQKQIAEEQYIQLTNKILSDRLTSIDQFGLVSQLNLFQDNYALKTGTSRDYQDSWIVGYTPDFLVGVWVGNADATPTDKLSGQPGAGKIWSQVMELLFNSPYNKKTAFDFSHIQEFTESGEIEYGLTYDNYNYYRNILKEQDTTIILQPHNGDIFSFTKSTHLLLQAKTSVDWSINGEFLGTEQSLSFIPPEPGEYNIQATGQDQKQETIRVFFAE